MDIVELTSLFTAPDTWSGGHYELFIEPSVASSDKLCSLLKALWSFPSLEGCYLRNDCEPSAQVRVQPCESGIPGQLYGIATLPTKSAIACGSHTMDYSRDEGFNAAHWVSFYLPLAALSAAYPVGAYPFGPMDGASEWKTQLDWFLTQIAQWTYSKVRFEFALVGFEVNWSALSREAIRLGGIPNERNDGILRSDGGELKWYPATRP